MNLWFRGRYSYKVRDKTMNHSSAFIIKDENDPKIQQFIDAANKWKDKPDFKMDFEVVLG